MHKKLNNESGVVMIVSLALLLMLAIIGISSMSTSNTDMQMAENEYRSTGAFYAAESGLEKAAASIKRSYETSGVMPDPLPADTVSEQRYTYGYYASDDGPAVNTQLTAGAYKGLYGLVKTFTINSVGQDNTNSAGVELEMQLSDALIPIFQFAVFYEYDLEIAPGPDMTLGGRVHSNRNMYLQAGSDLYIDSYLTAAGDINHGRKPGSGQSSTNNHVWIKDDNGTYQSMRNSDYTFLDSYDSDWVDESISRWGGQVEDGNHGITELYMPVVTDGPATDLIDRGAGNSDSYENKAGLKIIDGLAYYKNGGGWVDVTSNLVSAGIMSTSTFRDGREGQDVQAIDIDVEKLNSSAYFPSNGVIYSSTSESYSNVKALRLKNAEELAAGLTVATNNPLYTLGNYNTVNKKPASLITDALTILSNNWDDSKSWQSLYNRNATETQVNASFMTGNTETGASGQGYNGGFENLPRFLENWNNVKLTWRGSAVDLWYSRQSTSPWGGGYYSPPIRDWAYDPDLLDVNNLPPGTPLVNVVQRMNWKQRVLTSADLGDGQIVELD
jgi:flagellar basal body-associated protein FliL